MTTRINVNVDQQALLQRSREQTQSNRWAFLEGQNRSRVGKEAEHQRDVNRAARGLTANGSMYNNRLRQIPQRPEPAATRNGQELSLGHCWVLQDAATYELTTGVKEIDGVTPYSLIRTDPINEEKPLLFGCGTGTTWQQVTAGSSDQPPLPPDDFTVTCGPKVWASDSNSVPTAYYVMGTRTSGRSVFWESYDNYIILPSGRGNFLLLHVSATSWFTYRTVGYYGKTYAAGTNYNDTDFYTPVLNVVGCSAPTPDGVVSWQMFTGANRRINVFAGNNTTLRPLTTPSALMAVLDVVSPAPTPTAQATYYWRGKGNTFTGIYTQPVYPFADVLANLEYQLKTNNGVQGWTPSIFAALNAAAPFVDPAQIKAFPSRLRWGLTDNSQGGYARFQTTQSPSPWPPLINIYRDGLPLNYALWGRRNEEPDLRVWDPAEAALNLPTPQKKPRATLTLDPNRVARNGAADHWKPGAYWFEALNVVWDWEDPGYCRQMCLALGFTEADLTP